MSGECPICGEHVMDHWHNDFICPINSPPSNVITISLEWISVKDRLPENCEDVLVTDGMKHWVASILMLKDEKGWVCFASHPDYKRNSNEYGAPYLTVAKPTHWMPLPSPPKDEL